MKKGLSYGESDNFDAKAAVHPASVHDFNATILHLLSLDHERLAFHPNGIERRLTNVHRQVIKDIQA